MSNLGPYQDIVTDAARAGGVGQLIKQIEKNAVSKASPRLVLGGAAFGALITGSGWAADRLLSRRQIQAAQAAEAKKQLAKLVNEQTEPDVGEDDQEGPEADGPVWADEP